MTTNPLFAFGADSGRGYSSEGDVLVSSTADGLDLNKIWDESASAMTMWNKQRSALASLISYPTTSIADAIPQTIGGDHFEVASEFGEPTGLRAAPAALILGNSFEDYDMASRFSWKFLRSASAEQVRSVINRAMESDNRLVTGSILRRLFDPCEQVRSKGFGINANSRLLVLCAPSEAEVIATFRAGQETNGIESKYDFIPSASAPAYLTQENVVGQVAPGEFAGLEVLGSFGPAWVVPSFYLPTG